ncbi:crescentin [Caulobacter henricii]|uniref:Intermediate filament-like cell shape determinant CreS n=1 Tax=Caulobacter henricii TaxID=69395 RepID=A0A0P0P383_9CAUL|nr:crescentin [Caulobacter henricii]ALL15045.1 intermediate filament-like cell shape determinant CreS [Caulobacter henricii]
MRLLSKNVRDTKTVKPAMLVEDAGRPEFSERLIESTQAIGVRYETIHGGLDSISRVVEHLRAIEPLLAEIRQPVAEEFEARRAEHAELIALRANYEQALRQVAQAQTEERELTARLATAQTALGESDARIQAQDSALEDNALEIDRLRNSLLQSDLKVGNLDASLRDATGRIEHLVQDVDTLRTQSQDIDARRGEAEASLARASQENALLVEEVATLKKRIDQSGIDIARLSRIETDLEAQIAAERARLQAAENALAVHQSDSGRTIRGLESQVEAGRAEISALQTRLETATGRADKLEEMNGQISQRLAESSAQQQAVERRAGDLNVALERALDRIRTLEDEGEGLRQRHAGVDTARAAAIERADQLAKAAVAHDKTLQRAEERANQLRVRLETMQEAQDTSRRQHEDKLAELQAQIERLTSEAALAEGALEAARRDRSRLQMALLGATEGDLAEAG